MRPGGYFLVWVYFLVVAICKKFLWFDILILSLMRNSSRKKKVLIVFKGFLMVNFKRFLKISMAWHLSQSLDKCISAVWRIVLCVILQPRSFLHYCPKCTVDNSHGCKIIINSPDESFFCPFHNTVDKMSVLPVKYFLLLKCLRPRAYLKVNS